VNELLGLMVLTSPLWLFVILLVVGIAAALLIAKRYPSTGKKWLAGVITVLGVFVIAFADEIAGRVYFNYLCATQAGVKVYQTVELPAEYWDENGRPKFYANWDAHLGKSYPLKYKRGRYSSLFAIDIAGHEFIDSRSDRLLGEAIDFHYRGGWVSRNLSLHNSAIGCINYTEPSNRLIDRIFRPQQK
jgi:hypothetical protein